MLILLLLPIVSAVPGAPNAIQDETGRWIPVRITADDDTAPLLARDAETFEATNPELRKAIYEQIGDHDYAETYDRETQCPVIFQKKKPFFAQLDANGYFKPRTDLPFRPGIKPADVERQGITCGAENIRKIRPQRPPALRRPLHTMFNLERLRTNGEFGMGVRIGPNGEPIYFNPQLRQAILNGTIAPPRLPLPPPTITYTGEVIYDITYEQQELAALIIPVQFPDVEATVSIKQLEDNFFAARGLSDYYEQQSYGGLKITGDVLPTWYTLSQDMGYYGDSYEANVEEMIVEAIEAADPDVDFSQYDVNQDGTVDGLFVVHAGEPDENGGGNNEEIWSHYFTISPITVDGVKIIDYETVSEESPIGIIAHEFGHYLGLPDMYDTVPDDGTSKGTAEWSIMGYGGYLGEPGSFDPWSKAYMSWLSDEHYQEISENGYYTIVEDNSVRGINYYAIPLSETEAFFVENRHTIELMNGDEAGGIIIWHVDESIIDLTGTWNGCRGTAWDCNAVNGDAEHKLIDVEEADGKNDIDAGDLGEGDDAWFERCATFGGCQQNVFSDVSNPNSKSYEGTATTFIGVYSDIGAIMQLGMTIDGSKLEAPAEELIAEGETAPAEEKSLVPLLLIVGALLILGGGFIVYRFVRKKPEVVSPKEYSHF